MLERSKYRIDTVINIPKLFFVTNGQTEIKINIIRIKLIKRETKHRYDARYFLIIDNATFNLGYLPEVI